MNRSSARSRLKELLEELREMERIKQQQAAPATAPDHDL